MQNVCMCERISYQMAISDQAFGRITYNGVSTDAKGVGSGSAVSTYFGKTSTGRITNESGVCDVKPIMAYE